MNFIKSAIAIGLLVLGTHAFAQDANHAHTSTVNADTVKKKSIALEEHAQIGDTHITIEVWVTGAHRATSIEIDREFSIGDKKIPAGKYAVFTIPGKEKWTFILNTNWDQHLADDYNQHDDVLRVEATPRALPESVERLNYTITELSDTEAILSISWEKIKVNIPLKLNAN